MLRSGEMVATADDAQWPDPDDLTDHFALHGAEVHQSREDLYDRSARETIRFGTRFSCRNPRTLVLRVGYFNSRTRRVTILSADERRILSHFACDEAYVRRQLDSDYQG